MLEITKGKHWPEATIDGPHGPITITFLGRENERFTARYHRKSRAYPSSADLCKKVPDLAAAEAALPLPKERGEDPENDRAYDGFNRRYIKAARAELKAVLAALAEAGMVDAGATASFSRHAGCSCPCSPGFILSARVRLNGKPVDLHVA